MNKKSETALEWFFYGEEFELWKLQTKDDYLFFFGMIIVGVVALMLINRYYKNQRSEQKGKERVWKRLGRLAKNPHVLLKDVTLKLPEGEQTFDAVLLDKSGIYVVKVFGWGLKVFGIPDGDTWRLEESDRVTAKNEQREIPNPLIDLRKGVSGIQKILEEKGIKRIKIQPLVVFADIYSTPELYLGYGSNSTTYQDLKVWYQKQSGVKDAQYDFERVSSIFKNEIVK